MRETTDKLTWLKSLIPSTHEFPGDEWLNFAASSAIIFEGQPSDADAYHGLMWLSCRGHLKCRIIFRIGDYERELSYQDLATAQKLGFIWSPVNGREIGDWDAYTFIEWKGR